MTFFKNYRLPLLLIIPGLIFAFSAGSCSSTDDAQRKFENEAFRTPSGFTRTDSGGNIISEDPDDWRVSPMYSGFVDVFPAFPNPTSGETVTMELNVLSLNSVNGLEVYRFDNRGVPRQLFFDSNDPLPVGFNQIIMNPLDFSESGTIAGAVGLHRVFVFDRRDNLITYGDIKIE